MGEVGLIEGFVTRCAVWAPGDLQGWDLDHWTDITLLVSVVHSAAELVNE